MDAKDLRIETALGAHTNDVSTKYAQSGTALQTNGNKSYHDIGSNSVAKVDVPTARPCAIIGPDRVVQPLSTNDVYLKKGPAEPWPCTENIYQHPPEYLHKPADYLPPRNISPRQTFQENMQRIMVPPTYASVKNSEDRTSKNSKLIPSEAKYCDVPYTINPINNEPKIVKSSEGLMLNNNPIYTQPLPHQGWSGSGINVRPLRPYGAPELYQYPEYSNCPGPRPISMIRPHRNVHEDVPQVYQDRFYPEASLRFKPYPTTKEKQQQLPQARYDYLANYTNALHLHSPYPTQKYDIQKSMPPHPCPVYPPVPLKYLDRRMPVPTMERYQRSPNQQVSFNAPFCNQNIPPTYASVSGNCLQNRPYPYSPDSSTKPMIQNRFYLDSHNARKYYPNAENMYINDIAQQQTINNDLLYQSYPPINIHPLSPRHIFRKDSSMKGYEHGTHFRNIEYSANMNPLSRLPLQFSPQTISISPDSNISNDTTQTLTNTQEDCGYVSQSSTASVRSTESGVHRISRYETLSRVNKPSQKLDSNISSKDKKGLNVRQFLQMWNEGDEGNDNHKDPSVQKDSNVSLNNPRVNHFETDNNQEQLYVLGLVNVPNEELCKYDHIQKISKLPENIKGYNNIELLNQYEKLVESPNMTHFTLTPPSKQKDNQVSVRNIPRQGIEMQPRPISPLDVEAKISQSVIHKEVGCNFEIRPCSPQMLNVEVATPVHNVLDERLIEKVVNPIITKSPMIQRIEEAINDTSSRNSPKIQSCKMVNNQYPSPNINDTLKTNYCLQDLESNSGLCLASLPRLDNDMELNFPEINQQFINANKIEPSHTSIRDLPVLQTEISCNGNKILNKPFISEHLNSGSESDKEVCKLSKYRKHKRKSSLIDPNENDVNSKQHISLHRTNSVIIKNPENVRIQEEFLNIPLNNNDPSIDDTTYSLNVHLNSSKDVVPNPELNLNEPLTADICDTAIDFSINKTTNYIYNMNNSSDPLQKSITIDKNIISKAENTDHSTDKFCNTNSPKQFEIPNSGEFNISHPNSPLLSNLNCPDSLNLKNDTITEKGCTATNTDVLKANIGFQSTHKDNLINNSLNNHSKANDIDTPSVSTLPLRNIIPQSSVSCEDAPNNMKSYNAVTLNDSNQFSNNIENQVLSYGMVESQNRLKNTVHTSVNSNFVVTDAIEENPLNDVNVENNCRIESETRATSKEEFPVKDVTSNELPESLHVPVNKKNGESNGDNKIHENVNVEGQKDKDVLKVISEIETVIIIKENGIQTPILDKKENSEKENTALENDYNDNYTIECNVENPGIHILNNDARVDITNMVKVTTGMEVDIHTKENEILTPIIAKEEDNNFAALESDHNDLCTIESNSNNYGVENLITDGLDITNMIHTNNSIENTNMNNTNDSVGNAEKQCSIFNKQDNVNDFELGSMPVFHSVNTPFTQIVENVNKSESDISNTLTKKHYNTSESVDCAVFYQRKNECSLKKELFSPQIQNLLLHNDDFCMVLNNYQEKCINKFNPFYSNINCSILDENKYLLKPFTEKNICNNESKNDPNSYIKNILNTAEVVEEKVSCESVSNEREPQEIKEIDSCNTDTENLKFNIKELEDITERIEPETLGEENHVADCISPELEVAAVQTDEVKTNNDIESTENLHEIYREKSTNSVEFSRYRLSSRSNRTLKRSLSESAATDYTSVLDSCKDNYENIFIHANKRTKTDDSEILLESHMITENFTSFIQNNRRNSISTIYNDENVSFCIVIGNDCVLADENENCQKICYTEIPDDCLTTICTEEDGVNSELTEIIPYGGTEQCEYNSDLILQGIEDKTTVETWVEDVACMETVFNDDIAEDIIISAPSSPKGLESSGDESDNVDSIYNVSENEHVNELKYIYGNQMSDDNAQLVEKLYRTPQMHVNKTLINREPQLSDECNRFYDDADLEKVLSESNTTHDTYSFTQNDSLLCESLALPSNEEYFNEVPEEKTQSTVELPENFGTNTTDKLISTECIDSLVHSCESSNYNLVKYKKEEDQLQYAISSSPEVSSTTSEDKGSAILLKIRSYKGTKISEIHEMGTSFNQTPSHRFNNITYDSSASRPLITKAAQKYIPPLKETIRDLKVKLHLPKQSLYKLQQLKKSKEEPKINTNRSKNYIKTLPQENLKKTKPKPKFEDVLKSIDEIQFKRHKEKNKKAKQSIPKVIIKKNENGAHYASTQNKESFNPDLTGRKWQPWVFLEKSNFIDKMAVKQKIKAIYNHRKKMFVLAENFRKYKSISNSKFVISHPKTSDNLSTGKLKYTFRLKHN